LPAAVHEVELFADVEVKSVGSTQYKNTDRPLYGLPYDVIAKHLLPYLNTMSLVSFAQLSRQFYRRVMTVALAKFKAEFMSEISWRAKLGRGSSPIDTYSEKQMKMVKRSIDGITPMTIAYYRDISLVKWNKMVKFVRRNGENTEIFRRTGDHYNRELLKMCQRMDKFGSVDVYKKHVQANSAEVNRELRATYERMTQNIEVLNSHLVFRGYKCILGVKMVQSGGFMHSYFVPTASNLLERVKNSTPAFITLAEKFINTMTFEDLSISGIVVDNEILNLLMGWGAVEQRRLILKIKI
jgi:hypothetical protein